MVLLTVALLATACAGGPEAKEAPGGRTVVASFYPLAFVAERLADPATDVLDLTPPGAEAHDVELSLESRAALERADLVLYLGDLGFQPQVEEVVADAAGIVVAVVEGMDLEEPAHEGGEHAEEEGDPHVWLDPSRFASIVDRVAEGFARMDAARASEYRGRAQELRGELEDLDRSFRETLSGCAHDTLVVPHEAFQYLTDRYGLRQVGLAGLAPEGEPTAGRLGDAIELIQAGRAGAVFHEQGDEAERAASSLAADLGVPALPLSTLESKPRAGDYLSVMEANLESLREGLGCR